MIWKRVISQAWCSNLLFIAPLWATIQQRAESDEGTEARGVGRSLGLGCVEEPGEDAATLGLCCVEKPGLAWVWGPSSGCTLAVCFLYNTSASNQDMDVCLVNVPVQEEVVCAFISQTCFGLWAQALNQRVCGVYILCGGRVCVQAGSEINFLAHLPRGLVDEKIHQPNTFFTGQNNKQPFLSHVH